MPTLLILLAALPAQAQDDPTAGGSVKEVVRGLYAKSNVGTAIYLGRFRGFVDAGTAVALAAGYDFVDRSNLSAAVELSFTQGVHNGMEYWAQDDLGCQAAGGAAPCIEGDLRTYTFSLLVEGSFYPSRRLGVGLRAGGGVLFSPLLMDEQAYVDEVLSDWGISDPGYHGKPHVVVQGGPTIEYYTKLSHFSVGLDFDVFYALGFDLGLNSTGYLKYTF